MYFFARGAQRRGQKWSYLAEECSDEEWGDYLFFRDNPRGVHHEMWVHAVGCRKFFNVTRHTVSYEILETYKMGEQPSITAESQTAPREAVAESRPEGVRA